MRGWPAPSIRPTLTGQGFPAGAGMALAGSEPQPATRRIPRRCGDGPPRTVLRRGFQLDSPQVRGWPFDETLVFVWMHGFPAGAGMAPSASPRATSPARIPRRCGDGPAAVGILSAHKSDSPQVRGWPSSIPSRWARPGGFPAGAGMAPGLSADAASLDGIPRRCGDGPITATSSTAVAPDSPQVRGWPPPAGPAGSTAGGFPAGAGMAHPFGSRRSGSYGIPRRCGDGPDVRFSRYDVATDSPQVRGWPWQCRRLGHRLDGFPAGAGMARVLPQRGCAAAGIPRRCGDGPRTLSMMDVPPGDSPQVRGWPRHRHWRQPGNGGFPAGAGMARFGHRRHSAGTRIPRRCGDGPAIPGGCW